ncbi:hypothetical protein [Streptomyces sp. NPDC001530]
MLDSSSSVWVAGDEVHGEERSVVDARGEAVGAHDVEDVSGAARP